MPFSLFFLDFRVFTIKFPSSSRGRIIAPVTGSRGNGFGPLLAPVVGAFGAFSLLDEVDVDVWGNKLDAEFKIFVIFSNGRVCAACGLGTWLRLVSWVHVGLIVVVWDYLELKRRRGKFNCKNEKTQK